MGLLNNIKVFGKIMILVVIAAVGMAAIGNKGYSTIIQSKDGMAAKTVKVLSGAFLVLAILFYTILWTYVKGAVTVVAPA